MYLRMCLAYNAGVAPNLESMEAMKEQAPPMAKYVQQLLAERPDDKGPISVYIGIIRQLLTAFPGKEFILLRTCVLGYFLSCLGPREQQNKLNRAKNTNNVCLAHR